MAFVTFVLSVVACGVVLSLLPSDFPSSRANNADMVDYHLVPYAGDAIGA